MNLNKERYIILEIIPTAVDPKNGDIAQLSALKINGIKLEDRFDYRLDKSKIKIPDILRMLDYDNESFKYVKTTKTIMKNFKKFIEDLPLLIIDNTYTKNYLIDIDNKKESVFKYLGLDVSDDVFDKLMNKYGLEPSNYLVDLLYEALIKEL
jgi:DNA polymerase III alpha subunit (gram-positive type)